MTRLQPNSSKRKICVLLTATIDPKGVVFMQRNDPLIRENDYISSIKQWIDKTPYSILFCENSGYPTDKIEKIMKACVNRKTEYLVFDGQDFPRELGKGFGELLSIKYAVQHSNLIKNSDYVIKINGRYFIKNIEKIVRALLKDSDAFVVVDLKRNLTWADSRVFAFKASFITDYLSKFQDLINDSNGFYLEHALSRAVLRAISDGHKWIPLPTKPIIIGYSGTSNSSCRTSIFRGLVGEVIHRLKNHLNKRY